MKEEILAAVMFLVRFIEKSDSIPRDQIDKFKHHLTVLLAERFEKHWFPDLPARGQGYRCIRVNCVSPVDRTLQRAASKCGLHYRDLRLPAELTIWVDPAEVCYRLGESEGSYCTLATFPSAASTGGASPGSNNKSRTMGRGDMRPSSGGSTALNSSLSSTPCSSSASSLCSASSSDGGSECDSVSSRSPSPVPLPPSPTLLDMGAFNAVNAAGSFSALAQLQQQQWGSGNSNSGRRMVRGTGGMMIPAGGNNSVNNGSSSGGATLGQRMSAARYLQPSPIPVQQQQQGHFGGNGSLLSTSRPKQQQREMSLNSFRTANGGGNWRCEPASQFSIFGGPQPQLQQQPLSPLAQHQQQHHFMPQFNGGSSIGGSGPALVTQRVGSPAPQRFYKNILRV